MGKRIYTDYDFRGGARVTGLPTPTAPTDAVPLGHLDAALAGLGTGGGSGGPQIISEDLDITGTAVMFGSVIVADGAAVTVTQDSQWRVYR